MTEATTKKSNIATATSRDLKGKISANDELNIDISYVLRQLCYHLLELWRKNSTKSFLREVIIWFLNLRFRVSCMQFNNLCSTVIETQLHKESNIFLEFGMLILLKEVIVFNCSLDQDIWVASISIKSISILVQRIRIIITSWNL